MPNVTAAELNELAAKLEKALASHERIVAKRAQEIGDGYGKTYAKAADERIRDKDVELQRATDLVKELFRQRKPLERQSDQYACLLRRLKELARVAKERGAGVPAGVLLDAIAEASRVGYTNPDADQAFAAPSSREN